MNRYETGAIPDKAHNNLLLLLRNPSNMLDILNSSEGVLSISQENKLRDRIERLQSEEAITTLQHTILKTIGDRSDIFTGFKKFDFEKFKSLVVYFACKEKKLYKTKLMKLLWYADSLYFKLSTNSITGLQYAHLPRGPVIENRNILLSSLEQSKIITMIEDEETGGEYIISNCDLEEISLNEDELQVVDSVVNKFKDYNTKMISDYSHEEIGYKSTNMGDLISYEHAKHITF